jgi:hypothetical protein
MYGTIIWYEWMKRETMAKGLNGLYIMMYKNVTPVTCALCHIVLY